MSIYRGAGGAGDATADSASEALLIRDLVDEAEADAAAAAASATAAASSASGASSSASAASTSASNAATSATNAANSASSIAGSVTTAANSATAAQTAETAAELAETNAETAETNAAASASAASSSASGASTSATNASNSASAASTSATNASNSASAASTSASNASTSATNAASSASAASTSASNAATSETNAAASASAASTSATTATTQAGIATTQASNASTSATNASNSATSASTSASTATTQATNASNSASAAATSATNASNSASAASTSATNAANSATLAASYTPSQTGNSGKFLTTDGTNTSWGTVTGGVTSVTGTSPVVSSGGTTPAISLAANYGDTQNPYASKTANFVLAAPNGSAGAPTFRAVVAADIPTLNQNTTGTSSNVTGTVAVSNGGTGETTYTNGQLLIGNTTGNTLTKATLSAGTGISVTNGTGSISVANTGVTSIVAGTGISISGGTGAVTVTNSVSVNSSQLAKAWVNFRGGNGNTAGTINASFNVSSITVHGTGDYTVNFTNAMPSGNYVTSGLVKEGTSGGAGDMYLTMYESSTNPATSSVRVNARYGTSSLFDVNEVYVMVIGA
jgi:hypothetical protein